MEVIGTSVQTGNREQTLCVRSQRGAFIVPRSDLAVVDNSVLTLGVLKLELSALKLGISILGVDLGGVELVGEG